MGETILRRFAAWLALAAMPVLTWLLGTAAGSAADRIDGALPIEAVVTTAFATIGATIAAYLSVISLGMALAAPVGRGRGFDSLGRMAPVAWRRITATAIGATLASGVSLPALAQPDSGSPVDWMPHVSVATAPATTPAPASDGPLADDASGALPATLMDELAAPSVIEIFVPASASDPASLEPDPQPAAPAPEVTATTHHSGTSEPAVAFTETPATYTVAAGDSLWAIAAGLLGTEARIADVAQAWPLIYSANQDLIGSDPGLIFAGQVLTIPGDLR